MSELTCDNCRFLEFSKSDEPCADCNNNSNWEAKPAIKDSGERRGFRSGAVRDCAEGKGRCDLLPLDMVADYYRFSRDGAGDIRETCENILRDIDLFVRTRYTNWLFAALNEFCVMRYAGVTEDMFLELSKHYEEGAKKYAERNWEKGIPAHCYIDSAVRHLLNFMRGDHDEPHDRAFVWNIFGLIWTIAHKPECDDLPPAKKEEADETED